MEPRSCTFCTLTLTHQSEKISLKPLFSIYDSAFCCVEKCASLNIPITESQEDKNKDMDSNHVPSTTSDAGGATPAVTVAVASTDAGGSAVAATALPRAALDAGEDTTPAGTMVVDGSVGEGGGQILRTCLALSAITNVPVRFINIRAGRPNPGLGNQHLECVRATATICRAAVRGAAKGSKELIFIPSGVIADGPFDFNVGTAGSAMLVFQTVLPVLLFANQATDVRIRGGTHNMMAPPTDFIAHCFLPAVAHLGLRFQMQVVKCGFSDAGDVRFTIEPLAASACHPPLPPLILCNRGNTVSLDVEILCTKKTPKASVQGAETTLTSTLQAFVVGNAPLDAGFRSSCNTRLIDINSSGQAVVATLRCEHITTVFSSLGEKDYDSLITKCMKQFYEYVSAPKEMAVDEYLSDQLVLPMVLTHGGAFTTRAPMSLHLTTQIDMLRMFCGDDVVQVSGSEEDGGFRVTVQPRTLRK